MDIDLRRRVPLPLDTRAYNEEGAPQCSLFFSHVRAAAACCSCPPPWESRLERGSFSFLRGTLPTIGKRNAALPACLPWLSLPPGVSFRIRFRLLPRSVGGGLGIVFWSREARRRGSPGSLVPPRRSAHGGTMTTTATTTSLLFRVFFNLSFSSLLFPAFFCSGRHGR